MKNQLYLLLISMLILVSCKALIPKEQASPSVSFNDIIPEKSSDSMKIAIIADWVSDVNKDTSLVYKKVKDLLRMTMGQTTFTSQTSSRLFYRNAQLVKIIKGTSTDRDGVRLVIIFWMRYWSIRNKTVLIFLILHRVIQGFFLLVIRLIMER